MRSTYRIFVQPAIALILTGGALLVSAQTYGIDSSYDRWSRAQAEKVLNDSPWVSNQEVRIKREGQAQRVAGAPPSMIKDETNSVASGGTDFPIDFIFTLRLRSAMPIREALVRLKQLDAKYDAMDEKQKAAFDAKVKGLLDCPACENNYVITLSSKSRNSPGADAVYSTFKGARIDDVKRYIYIANERGERRELVHLVPPKAPGEETVLFFPRFDEKGTPLFTAESKEVIVNLTNNQVNISTNFRIDVTRLVRNGQLLF
ncbi:MAG TPA: hypothetical protein VGW76_11305 [Pyrinomonadaceae bacterium]|nr:hypothetical protein [Pyrinomonadaceae bacterium]